MSASAPATRFAWPPSRASTITRTSGSVPLGRSSTRPVVAELGLGRADRGGQRPRTRRPSALSTTADVDQDLRAPGHHRGQLGQRPAGARPSGQQLQRGQQAVAGGRVVEQDDVAGLLAAEREARRPRIASSTYRSPTGVSTTLDARLAPSRAWKPRLAMTVATTVSPASRPASRSASASTARIWSPSTTWPSASTARQRSASPSWAMPDVGAVLRRPPRPATVQVGRADSRR